MDNSLTLLNFPAAALQYNLVSIVTIKGALGALASTQPCNYFWLCFLF